MIYWRYDEACFGPKGSRVNWYTPEKVINAVYALIAKVKGAMVSLCKVHDTKDFLVSDHLSF